MVHQLELEGDRWRAESTGGSYEADGIRSAGAVFIHEATGRHLSGRLNPVDVTKPTDNRMREALAARLAEIRKKPPFVRATTATNGAEGFTINQEMYVWFERDPNEPPIVITGLALVPAWVPSSAAVCTPRAGKRKN